jgi:SAM-dependent methyltransferase
MPTQSIEQSQSPDAAVPAKQPSCRFCNAPLSHVFVDLGSSPLANSYLTHEEARAPERFYPLKPYVCGNCFLVQLPVHESPDHIFSDYAYFSSFTDSWVAHARDYSQKVIDQFGLGRGSLVVEIASNDGYLLQHFVARGIPVLGIEPAANVAAAAERKGIHTVVAFFGTRLALELAAERKADLIAANNVLAHVPALNDFVAGIAILLKHEGVATLEFPHLMQLMARNQFDTIYHEHYSYFSFTTVSAVFALHGLRVFDVEELTTHGGSLRVFACHEGAAFATRPAVTSLIERERDAGVQSLASYESFAEQVKATKRELLAFLIDAKRGGASIVGYGAPAKGNTLLNYCGIRSDFLDYTVDRSPHKQGRVLPGTHIPIYGPERILETRPNYVLILPWNLKEEVMQQMAAIASWGGRFVVPIPQLTVL